MESSAKVALSVAQKPVTQQHRLFLTSAPKKDSYLYDRDDLIVWDKDKVIKTDEKTGKQSYKSLHLPVVCDTEFYTPENPLSQQTRVGLTTQCKGIHPDSPKAIFLHPEHAEELNQARERDGLKPLPIVCSEAHFVDYLNSCGVDAKIESRTRTDEKLPVISFTMYAHLATAEIGMVFSGGMKAEVTEMIQTGKLISRRRLIVNNEKGENKKKVILITDWVEFENHTIVIDGIRYIIRLRIVDTCAIHGIASYADIAANVGHKLAHKDNFSKDEKGRMLEMALTRPKDFEDYSLGDLDVYDILAAYDGKWQEVHEKLALEDYYQTPKLTIGGTVKDLFLAKLAKQTGIKDEPTEGGVIKWQRILDKRVIKKYLNFKPSELRQYTKNTKCLLSKVEGGRCRNNRPTDIFVQRKQKDGYDTNLICDIDISGCYGEGQRNQPFIIGEPVTFGLDINQYCEYKTLREVIKSLGVKLDILIKKNRQDWTIPENWGELMPGGWCFRISTKENLKYGQDLFASWFTESGHGVNIMAKFIKENQANDTELSDKIETVDFDEEYGTIKIFEHEIHNGVLTHDGLQWILAVASPRQRNELLDKITVLSGAFYPRSQEIKPTSWDTALDELDDVYTNWKGKNTYELSKGRYGNTVINTDESCHAWFSLNLGDLIVNDLLIERKKAKVTHGDKSPLDQLFKLCVNTLYGDMVSKFFATSNPVVGNNITARARVLAWYMEKGFNGWQSITDGCGFLLNEVLKNNNPKYGSIDGETTISTRKERLRSKGIKPVALGNVDEILMNEEGVIFTNKGGELTEIGKWSNNSFLNIQAMEHLRQTFDCVDILHAETTAIKINKDLTVSFVPRVGQFSFETKDVYRAGAFHGSANYAFENHKGEVSIKMRGYELKKTHEGWTVTSDGIADYDIEGFTQSVRYGKDNNPGKDFMEQLLKNPESMNRQITAIREGILKVSEYQERLESCIRCGIEPGDTIKKPLLMQEFSLTQFTFKTYDQFISWSKSIKADKDKYSQSIESFFLNPDGTLDFVAMTNWVAEAIERGVMNPLEELDPHNHRQRSSKKNKANKNKIVSTVSVNHPSKVDYERVKKVLSKSKES